MAIDIVFPKNNEKAFIGMAARLGYSELCLAYLKDADKKMKRVEALQKTTGIKLLAAGGQKGRCDLVVSHAGLDSRELFEKARTDLVFGLEESGRKDFIFSRNSGLNHVLCRLAKEKGVMVGFSFSSIINAKNRQVIIGRVKQNIRLCSKYRVETVIASFAKDPYEMRSPHDLMAFFICLGMEGKNAKKSLESVSLKARQNKEKRSRGYIAEGISITEEQTEN